MLHASMEDWEVGKYFYETLSVCTQAPWLLMQNWEITINTIHEDTVVIWREVNPNTANRLIAFSPQYSQTRLIRTLLTRHFRLIRHGNLKTLKPLLLTPMLNLPFN